MGSVRQRAGAAVVVATAAFLIGGCATEASERLCTRDADCRGDEICQAGSCAPACSEDGDCSDGRACLAGVCSIVTSCATDADCGRDEVCDRRLCIPQLAECGGDRDCPPGTRCNGGACLPTGSGDASFACRSARDCSGAPCVDGRCETADAGASDADGACTSDDQCPDDGRCEDRACVPRSSDADADSGGADDPPDAVEPPRDTGGPDADSDDDDGGSACETPGDGQLGDRCGARTDCCNGLCIGDVSSGSGFCTERCATFDDCNPPGFRDDFFCFDVGRDGSFCVFNDFAQRCDEPLDCTGQVCLKGLGTSGCSWRCTRSSECGPGSTCGLIPVLQEDGSIGEITACAPVGSACRVDSGSGLNDCLSGTCLTDEAAGSGYCSVFCLASDPSPCPAGFRCEVVQPDAPAVCVR